MSLSDSSGGSHQPPPASRSSVVVITHLFLPSFLPSASIAGFLSARHCPRCWRWCCAEHGHCPLVTQTPGGKGRGKVNTNCRGPHLGDSAPDVLSGRASHHMGGDTESLPVCLAHLLLATLGHGLCDILCPSGSWHSVWNTADARRTGWLVG